MGRSHFQNSTEEFVFEVCRKSFLSLWSYANPKKKPDGDELCDVLVVCDPDVIVISVKHVELKAAASPAVGAARWLRRAVKKSAQQLYGAERWLKMATHVTRHDDQPGLPLPSLDKRRVHLVSVSIGAGRLIPIPTGDFGKGLVHVFDERSFAIVLQTLNTVSDLLEYLRAKGNLQTRLPTLVVEGGEENLLAVYLSNNRSFPETEPDGPVPGHLWQEVVENPLYLRKLEEDLISYAWDELIEYFSRNLLGGTLEVGNELNDTETILREMAQEDRFGRRRLAETLVDFREKAKRREVRARMFKTDRDVGYVLLNAHPAWTRQDRQIDLQMRMHVARGELECEKIIGLCINIEPTERGHSEDLMYLHMPEWTDQEAKIAEETKKKLGLFSDPTYSQRTWHEYPSE